MNEFEKLDRSLELAKTSVSKVIVGTLEKNAGRKMVEIAGETLAQLYITQKNIDQIKARVRLEQGLDDVLETAWRSGQI